MRDYYNWCLKLKENWKSKNITGLLRNRRIDENESGNGI